MPTSACLPPRATHFADRTHPKKPPLGDQGEVAGRRPDGGDQRLAVTGVLQSLSLAARASSLCTRGPALSNVEGWQRSATVHPTRRCGRLIAAPTGAVELAACWQPPETTGATVMAACRPPETVEKPQKTCEAAHRGKGGAKGPFHVQSIRKFKASPHNCVCGLRPIFCPIRAVIKGGNTYSIPPALL